MSFFLILEFNNVYVSICVWVYARECSQWWEAGVWYLGDEVRRGVVNFPMWVLGSKRSSTRTTIVLNHWAICLSLKCLQVVLSLQSMWVKGLEIFLYALAQAQFSFLCTFLKRTVPLIWVTEMCYLIVTITQTFCLH